MPEYSSWFEEQMAKSWRFRWMWRWDRWVWRWVEMAWLWITDALVWDFNKYPDGRLMHCRTKRFLDADDPRHFEE